MIHVVAVITAKPGQRDRILEAFAPTGPGAGRTRLHRIQRHGGRRRHAAFARLLGADTFVVIEKWETLAALQAHAAAPHMAAYGAKVKDWTENRVIACAGAGVAPRQSLPLRRSSARASAPTRACRTCAVCACIQSRTVSPSSRSAEKSLVLGVDTLRTRSSTSSAESNQLHIRP